MTDEKPAGGRRGWWTALAVGLVLMAGWALWPGTAEPPPAAARAEPVEPGAAPGPATVREARVKAGADSAPGEGTTEAEDFIAELRQRFGPWLHLGHARIKLIEQIIGYLKSRYPDDWEQRIEAFIAGAFPDLAEQLLANFRGLTGYNDFLAANRGALQAMSAAERREALWAARREAFGEQADEIWAAEIRNAKLQESLAGLGDAGHLRVTEKLEAFVEAIHEVYGEDAQSLLAQRRTELMNRFLDVDAVQGDLRAMAADERRAALRELRSGIGMDGEALQPWDALDEMRDAAWSRGQQYMAERGQLQAAGAGDGELAALRQKYFGEQAELIAAEEAGGFYRYDGERRIGRE